MKILFSQDGDSQQEIKIQPKDSEIRSESGKLQQMRREIIFVVHSHKLYKENLETFLLNGNVLHKKVQRLRV